MTQYKTFDYSSVKYNICRKALRNYIKIRESSSPQNFQFELINQTENWLVGTSKYPGYSHEITLIVVIHGCKKSKFGLLTPGIVGTINFCRGCRKKPPAEFLAIQKLLTM